jgi:hypothetical protein
MGAAELISLKEFSSPSFRDPEYELVALHPEHFLPRGSTLTVSDRLTGSCKNYVAAKDQHLCESLELDSPRFLAFHHNFECRNDTRHMNVFLVVLNAEIKFERYLKMVCLHPPTTPLPQDVLTLMKRTMELVELIYWEPIPRKGSNGEKIAANWGTDRRQNPGRVVQPGATMNIESKGEFQEDKISPCLLTTSDRRRTRHLLANMDLETRKAYGRAIMSGHGTFLLSYSCTPS